MTVPNTFTKSQIVHILKSLLPSRASEKIDRDIRVEKQLLLRFMMLMRDGATSILVRTRIVTQTILVRTRITRAILVRAGISAARHDLNPYILGFNQQTV